jgi:fluoroquinolone resistance protein
MEKAYIEEKQFEKTDFTEVPLAIGEYERCHFNGCDFTADLSYIHFTECVFTGCNLSMAKLHQTALRDVQFIECKLVGLHFENCNEFLFAIEADNCVLNLSSFYQRKIKKTIFKNSSLHEVDFTEADLTGSVFDNCDLANAIFQQSIIEKADFRSAYHYSINPDKNRIKKARFSMAGIAGLLDQYDIEIE